MLDRKIPKNFVLIDFVDSGDSLAETKRFMDFYLRYKNQKMPGLLDINPEYLGLYYGGDDAIFEVERLRRVMNLGKVPFKTSRSGTLLTNHVSPGQVIGDQAQQVNLDVDQLKQVLNQKTEFSEWHWYGRFIDIEPYGGDDLYSYLQAEQFDRYSPYGSWKINESPLVTKPQVRIEYQDFVDALFSCP